MSGAEELGVPLQSGSLRNIPPNAGNEEQIAALNSVIDRLNGLLKSQTFADESSQRYVNGLAPGRWPGGDFGMAISKEGDSVFDVEFEDLLFAWDYTTGTQYWYDPTSGKNYMQTGILPNGVGGQIIVKSGVNVNDVFN